MTIEILVYIIIAINVLFSWQGFNNPNLFEKFKFNVGAILNGKEYYRIITSGFLHGSYTHLGVNMLVLYFFGSSTWMTMTEFLILYFGSLIIGNLISLFINKNNSYYSAIGASGAVSGLVYAIVVYAPFHTFYLYFAIPIWAWLFGILYLLYSVYGMNKNNDNIGHEAHIGGSIGGIIFAVIFEPSLIIINWWIILILLAISIGVFIFKPKKGSSRFQFTILNNDDAGVKRTKRSIDDLYYNKEFEKEKELNALLEKVSDYGINSLSKKERTRLQELSK